MIIPKKIRDMPWPDKYERNPQISFQMLLSWPVIDHERYLVVTFNPNAAKGHPYGHEAGFRLVASKKQNRAAIWYNGKNRGCRDNLRHALHEEFWTSPGSCYPEISPDDERNLKRWLGGNETMNHMIPELEEWCNQAMDAEKMAEAEARGEIGDDEWKLCQDELPDGIERYIEDVVLPNDHVLLYKKGNVRGTCYACRNKVKAFMQRFTQHNITKCPVCGTTVTCILEGSDYFKADYVQNIASITKGTDGRTLFIRQWHLLRPKDADWSNIPGQMEEIARYAIRGNKIAQWRMEGKENWYMKSFRYKHKSWERFQQSYSIYDGSYCWYLPVEQRDILQGTSLQYCNPAEYTQYCNDSGHKKDEIRFLMDWARYPAIEKLWKAGYRSVVADKATSRTKENRNAVLWGKDRLQDAVRFPFRILKVMDPGEWDLGRMQRARELWQLTQIGRIREAEIGLMLEADVQLEHIEEALQFATASRILTYLKSQSKNEKNIVGIGISSDYRDYIRDCIALELHLEDKAVLFPSNLSAAHTRTIQMREYKANKKAVKDFEAAKKKAEKLSWEFGDFLIRPAGSQEELIAEGQMLHHCVGGYADRMAAGRLVIMLIRRKENPDTPFFTLEWTDGRIEQCRTLCNKSYDSDPEVFQFVQEWKSHIINKIGRKDRKTA